MEDVEDMGGSCWCYLRVAVHGVATGAEGGRDAAAATATATAAVAVGDTFLFSVGKKLVAHQHPATAAATATAAGMGMGMGVVPLADSSCLTHAVPYYRCLLGQVTFCKSAACDPPPHTRRRCVGLRVH